MKKTLKIIWYCIIFALCFIILPIMAEGIADFITNIF